MRRTTSCVGCLLSIVGISAAAAGPPAPEFTVTEVVVPGSTGTWVSAISGDGDVAGTFWNGQLGGFVRIGGQITTFELPPGMTSSLFVNGINDFGQVVLYSTGPGVGWASFLWQDGVFLDLGFIDQPSTEIMAINDAGLAVGTAGVYETGSPPGQAHAVLWSQGDLADLGYRGIARAINDAGAVTGSYGSRQVFPAHAFLHVGATVTLLDESPDVGTQGWGINDQNEITGIRWLAGQYNDAFIWLPAPAHGLPAGMTLIGGIGGGKPLGIANDGTVVGWSTLFPPNGSSAFVWSPGAGLRELNDLVPAGSGWTLERAVGISDQGEIAGSGTRDGQSRGFILTPIPTDADGDGLLDDWERNGVPYLDGKGEEKRLVLDVDGDGESDADPMHKDLFVEIDAMSGIVLLDEAEELVTIAFEAAPLPNPDGEFGIRLHMVRDESMLPHLAVWPTASCWPDGFDDWVDAWFGSPAERGAPEAAALLAAKRKAYRYCIVADRSSASIGGCGEVSGDDFVVFIGSGKAAYAAIDQAAVFMHELGHNLGLRHGGHDGINGKSNYPSVMNYVLSYRSPWNEGFWRLDFSRVGPEELGSLDESALDENAGVGSPGGYYANFLMPFGTSVVSGEEVVRAIRYVALDGSPVDFGSPSGDGMTDGVFDESVSQDLNFVVDVVGNPGLPATASPGDVHECHDDWSAIVLATPAALGDAAAAPTYPDDELTTIARAWIDANFPSPAPACPGDLSGDGAVGLADLLMVLASWGTPDADINGDGTTGLPDLLAVLAAWGTC